MGKKGLYGFGGLLMLGGVIGVYNAIADRGAPEVEKVDLVADGNVTEVDVTQVKHATGIVLNSQYRIHYSFVAQDGKTYHDEDTVQEATARSVSKGQTIPIRYHSTQPSISASPFGTYVSVSSMPSYTFQQKLLGCGGMLLAGLAVVFCTWKFVIDEEPANGKQPVMRKAAAPRGIA